MISIPSAVVSVMQQLLDAGYEAYIVGGCVRDQLMDRPVTDYDVTTSATPDEITTVFSGYKIMDFGQQHGTVAVYYQGEVYEITTYRTEGTYSDGRRPDTVQFVRNLSEDLARRDFTINAMAADIRGKVVDLYGGEDDIKAGVIRAVGVPTERFNEDSLRILRAFRFALRYDFQLEVNTAQAIISANPLLIEHQISSERIATELDEIFRHGHHAVAMLQQMGTLQVLFPQLDRLDHVHQAYRYTNSSSADVNLAILLQVHYPATRPDQLQFLKEIFKVIKGWGKYRETKVQQLLDQGQPSGTSDPELLRWIDRYTKPLRPKQEFQVKTELIDLLEFASAVSKQELQQLYSRLEIQFNRLEPPLPLDGHDAKALGYRGPQIQAVINIWEYCAIYLDYTQREQFLAILKQQPDEEQLRQSISHPSPTYSVEEDTYLQWLQQQFTKLK